MQVFKIFFQQRIYKTKHTYFKKNIARRNEHEVNCTENRRPYNFKSEILLEIKVKYWSGVCLTKVLYLVWGYEGRI